MMQLFLEPVDVWLFRDGRPFDAGSDHRARSLFPPYPTVMQGAIRSHELVLRKVDLGDKDAIAEAVGTADDYGALRLRGPMVARCNDAGIERYFPVPADLRVLRNESTEALRIGAIPPGVVIGNRSQLPQLLFPVGQGEKEGRGRWLTECNLICALAGHSVTAVANGDLYQPESRVGIERDEATRATVHEKLYEAEFIRPSRGVGLWVEMDGYKGWPADGYIRIGGEGRATRFRQIEPMAWPGLDLNAPLPKQFRLYFAAPTYFSQGWRPPDWDTFFDRPVTLEAVALKGYETSGGFDWAAGKQKASRRFVPAGSVYYFSAEGPVRLRSELTNRAVTEWGGEIGFGQVVAVEWRE